MKRKKAATAADVRTLLQSLSAGEQEAFWGTVVAENAWAETKLDEAIHNTFHLAAFHAKRDAALGTNVLSRIDPQTVDSNSATKWSAMLYIAMLALRQRDALRKFILPTFKKGEMFAAKSAKTDRVARLEREIIALHEKGIGKPADVREYLRQIGILPLPKANYISKIVSRLKIAGRLTSGTA
jgi:hypothetical protein